MFDHSDIPSTQTEWDNADASQRGYERPDQAWVCTDRDVVHANPYYQGSLVCHPECGCNGGEPGPGCLTNPPQPKPAPITLPAMVVGEDEIPF